MVAVIFEAWPAAGKGEAYLAWAASLQSDLLEQEGFLSVERYGSLVDPGKVLSLSFWKDETSVAAWRQKEAHRQAQREGRETIFSEYRIRVAPVVRDYSRTERAEAPLDSQKIHP